MSRGTRSVLLLVAIIALAAREARATGVPVVDVANLAKNAQTALKMAEQIQKSIEQIQKLENQIRNQREQIQYQLQTLRRLNPKSFDDVMGLVREARFSYNDAIAGVDAISFSIKQVDADYRRLFPKNEQGWRAVPTGRFDPMYTAWNAELTSSSLVAMRAQTQLSTVEKTNTAAAQILAQSKAADGEVRQLQAITQMLGVMQSQLTNVIQSLATSSRVIADMAASSASNNMMTREAKRRRREGYTNPGKPPKVLTRLP